MRLNRNTDLRTDAEDFISLTEDDLKNRQPDNKFVKMIREERKVSPEGLIKSDGSINWQCPCMGNMFFGPCGYQLRKAFKKLFFCIEETKKNPELNFDKLVYKTCLEDFEALNKCQKFFKDYYKNEDILSDAMNQSNQEIGE